jgi:hypothetical protein
MAAPSTDPEKSKLWPRYRQWLNVFDAAGGWFVERDGRRVALLTDPKFENMFSYTWRLEPLVEDAAERAAILSSAYWDARLLPNTVFRSRELGTVADGFWAGTGSVRNGRLVMRVDWETLHRVLQERGVRPRWPLETRWYQCLLFPLRNIGSILGLAFCLAIYSGLVLLLRSSLFSLGAPAWFWFIVAGLLSYLIVGNACGFLQMVLRSGLNGETGQVFWTGWNLALIGKCLKTWLIALLAGPIVPFGVALLFWLYAGVLTWVDWLIVAELAIVATALFLYVFLSLVRGQDWHDARPPRVLALIRQLGWRGGGIIIAASILAVAHGWLMLVAIELFPGNQDGAWFLQGLCWTSGLFLATFFFRWLGLAAR